MKFGAQVRDLEVAGNSEQSNTKKNEHYTFILTKDEDWSTEYIGLPPLVSTQANAYQYLVSCSLSTLEGEQVSGWLFLLFI